MMTVSRHVAGFHLATLSLAEVPRLPLAEPPSNRHYTESGKDGTSPHLFMSMGSRGASNDVATSRGCKNRKRGKGKGRPSPGGPQHTRVSLNNGPATSALNLIPIQPAKAFIPSAFYGISSVWEAALKSMSPVPPSNMSALYFYPPPFLLDTVTGASSCPTSE